MKLPNIPPHIIFVSGSLAFSIQAMMSIIIYFMNLNLQTIFSTIGTWAGILFNFLIGYWFFTMYQDQKPSDVRLDEDFDPKKYVDEALK